MIRMTPVFTGTGVILVPVYVPDPAGATSLQEIPPIEPVEPVSGVELFVKAAMVVPTVADGFANVRLEMAQTTRYDPSRGHSLADRQAIADTELRGCLTKLMEQAEVIRAGNLITTAQPRRR